MLDPWKRLFYQRNFDNAPHLLDLVDPARRLWFPGWRDGATSASVCSLNRLVWILMAMRVKLSAILPSSVTCPSRLIGGQAEPPEASGSSTNSPAGLILFMMDVSLITYAMKAALNYLCREGRSWLLMPWRPLLIIYAVKAALDYLCHEGRSWLLMPWRPLLITYVVKATLEYLCREGRSWLLMPWRPLWFARGLVRRWEGEVSDDGCLLSACQLSLLGQDLLVLLNQDLISLLGQDLFSARAGLNYAV